MRVESLAHAECSIKILLVLCTLLLVGKISYIYTSVLHPPGRDQILSAWRCMHLTGIAKCIQVIDQGLVLILHIQGSCLYREVCKNCKGVEWSSVVDPRFFPEEGKCFIEEIKRNENSQHKTKKYPVAKQVRRRKQLTIRPGTPPGPGAPSSPLKNRKITINKR